MDIKVNLPKPINVNGKEIKKFIRQLELSVHHIQKAYEEMEANGDINENSFVTYRFPQMDLYSRDQDDRGNVLVHVDEESDAMQDIQIEITSI